MSVNEYVEGSENVGLVVFARPDGNVSLKVYLYDNGVQGEQVCGMVLPPGTARSVASNLTLASWKAEDIKKWQDDQLEP